MYFYPSAYKGSNQGWMHLSGVQIIIKTCSGSHGGIFWVENNHFYLAQSGICRQFCLWSFSTTHAAWKGQKGWVPLRVQQKKIKQNLSSLVTAGGKTFTKAAGIKPHLEHGAGFWIGSLEQRRYHMWQIGRDLAINKPSLLKKIPFAEFDSWGSSPPLVRVWVWACPRFQLPTATGRRIKPSPKPRASPAFITL